MTAAIIGSGFMLAFFGTVAWTIWAEARLPTQDTGNDDFRLSDILREPANDRGDKPADRDRAAVLLNLPHSTGLSDGAQRDHGI
jgi:hypothetical protein